MISSTKEEIEQDRQDELVRMVERHELTIDALKTRYQGDLGYQEAIHTAYIMMENVESYLMEHPCVALDATAWELAHNAHTALYNLYQCVALLQFSLDEDKQDSDDNDD